MKDLVKIKVSMADKTESLLVEGKTTPFALKEILDEKFSGWVSFEIDDTPIESVKLYAVLMPVANEDGTLSIPLFTNEKDALRYGKGQIIELIQTSAGWQPNWPNKPIVNIKGNFSY